ncbi:MAG: DUF899 domain-containing protein [Tagaea sp.]|nr:DUF899 domain-containing protein [Tagaea sp.]
MTDTPSRAELGAYRREIRAQRAKLREARAKLPPEPVRDYELKGPAGAVKLSALFDARDELIVVHNMGAACPYCTLWADGFNGVYPHLADRAPFVVTTPDAPAKQSEFATSRGWRFPMLSHEGTSFAEDMGFKGKNGWEPGLSVLTRKDGKLFRVASEELGPGDDFCAAWHFFDLLPGGGAGWRPKFAYG